MTEIELRTGARMPILGLGTWMMSEDEAEKAVYYALSKGYRHIDCARAYGNEEAAGAGLARAFDSGAVMREDVFITSKLPNMMHRAEDVAPTCKATLAALKVEQLDLYLMHWGIAIREGHREPDLMNVPIRETWEAMQELVAAGLVKAIGVANFTAPMLIDIFSYASVKPAVNQIELHPYLQQERLVAFCQHVGIAVTAYSPLGRPGAELAERQPRIIDDAVIQEIAKSRGKTPAQIILRWGVQRNTAVIPKSTSEGRIRENIDIFDFTLSETEMQQIRAIDRKFRYVDPYLWADIPYFD